MKSVSAKTLAGLQSFFNSSRNFLSNTNCTTQVPPHRQHELSNQEEVRSSSKTVGFKMPPERDTAPMTLHQSAAAKSAMQLLTVPSERSRAQNSRTSTGVEKSSLSRNRRYTDYKQNYSQNREKKLCRNIPTSSLDALTPFKNQSRWQRANIWATAQMLNGRVSGGSVRSNSRQMLAGNILSGGSRRGTTFSIGQGLR